MAGYSGVQPTHCQRAADYLTGGFVFDGSPEGGSFWYAVHKRLVELGRGGNTTVPCWRQDDTSAKIIKLLEASLQRKEEEIDRQAKEIVVLRSKLLTADFCNMLGPRSAGF